MHQSILETQRSLLDIRGRVIGVNTVIIKALEMNSLPFLRFSPKNNKRPKKIGKVNRPWLGMVDEIFYQSKKFEILFSSICLWCYS